MNIFQTLRLSLSHTHIHTAHNFMPPWYCVSFFSRTGEGTLGNALMVSHRGPKTTDSAMQSSRGRLWPSFTGMENCRDTDPQGLAGTSGDRKPWRVPTCLVPASVMPLPLVPGRGWRRVPVGGLLLLPPPHRDHAFRRTRHQPCVAEPPCPVLECGPSTP